jgi:hypothetical protein
MADVAWAAIEPRLAPGELQSFAQEADRERLTEVALKAFRALSKRWRLSNPEAAALLGVSGSTWDRIKRGDWEGRALLQDQLTRVSAAVGIFKGLHLLFVDDETADRWPKLANKGPLFARRTPVEAMVEGGIPVMLEVRRYVDAVRGGL